MAGRSPAGPLMHEHRVIERMLKVLSRQLESMFELQAVDTAAIDTAVDFIRTYADRCHHGKEEDILFRRLADKDLDPQLAGVMADLIDEHVMGEPRRANSWTPTGAMRQATKPLWPTSRRPSGRWWRSTPSTLRRRTTTSSAPA